MNHNANQKYDIHRKYVTLLKMTSSSSSSSSTKSSKTKQKRYRKSNKDTTKDKPSPPTARSVAVSALANAAAASSRNNNNNKKNDDDDHFYYFASRMLEANPDYTRNLVDQRDRSYARLLVATVERYMGQIDKVLSILCKDVYPPTGGHTKHAYIVRAALQIGAAQILYLNTPHHAAVKETVNVLKMKIRMKKDIVSKPLPEARIKFVNAILRSITRQGHELLQTQTSSLDNISPWLVNEWSKSWGGFDVATNIANTMMRDYNGIDISSKLYLSYGETEEGEMMELCEEFGTNAILLPHGSIRIIKEVKNHGTKKSDDDDDESTTSGALSGAVSKWPRYEEGVWWIQDAAAALPALALRNAFDIIGSNENGNKDLSSLYVVDMCAAPGGKTSQLLSMGFGHVTAVESNARRSRRLIENLNRLGFYTSSSSEEEEDGGEEALLSQEEGERKPLCDVVISDGRSWLPSSSKEEEDTGNSSEGVAAEASVVNGILLDVPCSATGTGAHNPDVLRKDPDLGNLLQIQEELVNHCVDDILPIGGVLVYATCSLLKVEGEGQVDKLLARGGLEEEDTRVAAVMKTIPFEKEEIAGFDDAIDSNGWLRVLPGMLEGELGNCDGFFVARLVKVA